MNLPASLRVLLQYALSTSLLAGPDLRPTSLKYSGKRAGLAPMGRAQTTLILSERIRVLR